MPSRATFHAHEPAGTSTVIDHAAVAGVVVIAVAGHGGAQSSGHPSSDWSEPTRVTDPAGGVVIGGDGRRGRRGNDRGGDDAGDGEETRDEP